MAKLNQIIAIEKGIKSRNYSALSALNKLVQKPDLFHGFTKKYQPKYEEDEELPSEQKKVQRNCSEVTNEFKEHMLELMRVTARKDWSNCVARADIKLGGNVIATDVPVTYLLFLEKQFNDFKTFVGNLPVLDPSENWSLDENTTNYRTDVTKTHRTKKTQKPIVLYDATAEHPAQTQIITEDVIVGFWDAIKISGAIPASTKARILKKVEVLIDAIKEAREEANSIEEVAVYDIGGNLFEELLSDRAQK